jgi:hypothetical protein
MNIGGNFIGMTGTQRQITGTAITYRIVAKILSAGGTLFSRTVRAEFAAKKNSVAVFIVFDVTRHQSFLLFGLELSPEPKKRIKQYRNKKLQKCSPAMNSIHLFHPSKNNGTRKR